MSEASQKNLPHALTVDVEEFYHATNIEPIIPPSRWHSTASRVEYSTRKTLEIFERGGARGTFFILGNVARRHPALVKEILAGGHEIASHGYGHRLAYSQSPRSFYRDIRKAKLLLEDITGVEVLGYRAPNFSIRGENLWAYDQLVAAGYKYDSSLYPVAHNRYGNLRRSLNPELRECHDGPLAIFPLAVCDVKVGEKELRLPIAGGAYWRIFPLAFTQWGLKWVANKRRRNLNCYLHPWEFDAGMPYLKDLKLTSKLRHYTGVAGLENKVASIIEQHKFGTILEIAELLFPKIFDRHNA